MTNIMSVFLDLISYISDNGRYDYHPHKLHAQDSIIVMIL